MECPNCGKEVETPGGTLLPTAKCPGCKAWLFPDSPDVAIPDLRKRVGRLEQDTSARSAMRLHIAQCHSAGSEWNETFDKLCKRVEGLEKRQKDVDTLGHLLSDEIHEVCALESRVGKLEDTQEKPPGPKPEGATYTREAEVEAIESIMGFCGNQLKLDAHRKAHESGFGKSSTHVAAFHSPKSNLYVGEEEA